MICNVCFWGDSKKWTKKCRAVAGKLRNAACFCLHPETLQLLSNFMLNSRSVFLSYRITTICKSRCECDTVIITQVLSTLLKFWTKLCGVLFGIDPWYCGPYRTNTQGSDIFLNVLWPIWSRYFNVRHRYYQVCGIYSINDIESRLKVKNRKLVSDFICALQLMLSLEQFPYPTLVPSFGHMLSPIGRNVFLCCSQFRVFISDIKPCYPSLIYIGIGAAVLFLILSL